MQYIVCDKETEKVLRSGCIPDRDFALQAGPGEKVIEGKINDLTQKVKDGKIVDKTPAEIEAEKPPAIKDEDQPALISKGAWQQIQDRIANLEKN